MERLTHPRNNGIKTGYLSSNKKDELIERLAAYEDTGVTPQEIYSLKAQEVLKALGREWISVVERLPEDPFESVIGWDSYRERCCFVRYWGNRWILGDGLEPVRIVAWMPLPEPYKPKG